MPTRDEAERISQLVMKFCLMRSKGGHLTPGGLKPSERGVWESNPHVKVLNALEFRSKFLNIKRIRKTKHPRNLGESARPGVATSFHRGFLA